MFESNEQLYDLISGYPQLKFHPNYIHINIWGALLDYMARSGTSFADILIEFPELREYLFKDNPEFEKNLSALIEATYNDYSQRVSFRDFAKENDWIKVIKILNKLDDEAILKGKPSTKSVIDRLADHRVEGVIWQLSDLHFGKLNLLGFGAKDLARILGLAAKNDEGAYIPNLILISGDISTCASKDEFSEFCEFADNLGEEVWGMQYPHRILVVPGNHDTTWFKNGKADKFRGFISSVSQTGKVVTPFWQGNRTPSDSFGEITVNTFRSDESEDIPPFCLVTDKTLKIQILMLVSPYFSGIVPENIIKLLQNISDTETKESLEELLRQDTGEMDHRFLSHLKRRLEKVKYSTIALTHHNLEQYDAKVCMNPNAKTLLKTLYEKRVMIVTHGHTHLIETSLGRAPNKGEAFPIPCPTLCSDLQPQSKWGFFMHLIGPPSIPREITTISWEIDSSKFFKPTPDWLKRLYRFTIFEDKVEVLYF